jgi:hypothetical protein
MAHETYIKPHAVTFASISISKVDEIACEELGDGEALWGDAATWPTANKVHRRNARITITTRDHAGYDSCVLNTAGTLAFTFKDEAGADHAKSFQSLIVKNRSGRWGGRPQAGQIVLEVESATGAEGPWS